VALIGPSGGGKTTFLRCINGLASLDSGTVRIGDDRSLSVEQHRRLFGMVFQDFQLFPHLTALENIILAPMQVAKVSKDEALLRARRLLERIGLADREDAYPRELSGGQKQRIAIARAMAMEPRGLLCDEITSALDPELKHEVLEVLADLDQEGLTLILVTHEIGFARRAADRVLFFANGKILEDGSPEQVLDHPKTDRARTFLSRLLG
jgi:ABC-type polar amino acid transport system ATPase subunit